jgi:hypothetical protein
MPPMNWEQLMFQKTMSILHSCPVWWVLCQPDGDGDRVAYSGPREPSTNAVRRRNPSSRGAALEDADKV